jgi:N-methylhydantoinase A/oxoprolinase/acetone carboxylase beta subunit
MSKIKPALRIGVDVGGTNTDAVLMGAVGIEGKTKVPTTPDVTTGVLEALRTLTDATGVLSRSLEAVMIGTTHFTNAVIQRRALSPVAIIRLGLPATACLPPMTDWPAELQEAIASPADLLHGGNEFDGRVIAPIRPEELEDVLRDIEARGVREAAIISVFSPIDASMEEEIEAHLRSRFPGLGITLSHSLGRIGLLERENTAILNACLRPLAKRTIRALESATRTLGLTAPMYLTQNDGTLMSVTQAERFPVLTFASGPTNSMRGAAFLSGVQEALVVDIGGTTTDVGAVVKGFPREASVEVEVGGVRTNLRMPDLHSIPLGGGSLVTRGLDGVPMIGPESVGSDIHRRARVFGGDELTATDIAVAIGRASVGEPNRVKGVPEDLARTIDGRIREMIELAVERVRLSATRLPVVVVGGGRILLGNELSGAASVMVPEHFEVANAVGAAIAQVSGDVERVVDLADATRTDSLEAARREAESKALEAGADPASIRLLELEEVPLTYLPGNVSRIRAKVVGDLAGVGARQAGHHVGAR